MKLSELLRKVSEYRNSDVRTALPVEVTAYASVAQTVNVKPLIKNLVEATDGIAIESLPIINTVPVAFPRSGGYFITFPIAVGDTGQIVICDRSIDQWHKQGKEVEPLDRRIHHFNGAVFYPGLSPSTNPIVDAHATDMVMGKDGDIQIQIRDGQIEVALTGQAQKSAALAEPLQALYVAHTHSSAVGPTGVPIQLWDTAINSTRLKVGEN